MPVLADVLDWVSVYRLRRRAEVGRDVVVRGELWIRGPGRIVIGDRVVLDCATAPIELHVGPGATIELRDDVYVGGGTSIESQKAVTVGLRSRIGRFSKIIDNHFHNAAGKRHERPPSVAVVIEDDVELGPRSILLPGAHLGEGTRVVSGSVVTRRVPPRSLVSGVPAVLRPLPGQVGGGSMSGAPPPLGGVPS